MLLSNIALSSALSYSKVAEAVASEEYFAPSYSVRLDRCEVKYNPQLTGSWSGRADSKTGVSPEAVASCLAFDLVEFIPADPGTSSGLYSYVFGSSGTSTRYDHFATCIPYDSTVIFDNA